MSSRVKKFRFPRYKHIFLRPPGKCACDAMNALQTQPRYTHTFSVYQRCAYNEYLVYHDIVREILLLLRTVFGTR